MLGRHDRKLASFCAADHHHWHGQTNGPLRENALEVIHSRNGLTREGRDNVALGPVAYAGLLGSTDTIRTPLVESKSYARIRPRQARRARPRW